MEVRSNSRHCPLTSWDATSATPGSSGRRISIARRSCEGSTHACRKHTASASTSASLRRSAIAGRAPSSSGASSRPRWSSRPRTSNLQAAGDERPRLAVGEVVEVGPVRASDLEHVSEALGGQQRGPGAAAFRDGVDHDRRAVDEGRDVGGVDPRASATHRARPPRGPRSCAPWRASAVRSGRRPSRGR